MSHSSSAFPDTLPALGADPSTIIVSGFSAGSFTTSQLMTVHPRTFSCAGMLNGGMTNTQMARKQAYSDAATQDDFDTLYEETKDIIETFERQGYLPNQALLKDKPMFIWQGEQDKIVPNTSTAEQKKYFEEKGAKINFVSSPDHGHWYDPKSPYNIAKWCYENVEGETKTVNDYTYDAYSTEFLNQGTWARFNQQEFSAAFRLEIPNLREWGFYYVPNACQSKTSKCKLQLVLHGGAMLAETFANEFVQYGAANDIIMIFPQATASWESANTIGSDPRTDPQYTRDGHMMQFFFRLMQRATFRKSTDFESQLDNGKHEYLSVYASAEGTKDKDGNWDKKDWDWDQKDWGDKDGWGKKTDKSTDKTWDKSAWEKKKTEFLI